MHKLYRATLLGALAFAAGSLLLASCDNSYGSLSSIQTEVKQSGNTNFKYATVSRALRFGAKYYACTAKINVRDVGSDASWSILPVNGGNDYAVMGLVTNGTVMYASILDADDANKVYSYDGSAWTDMSASIPSGAWLDQLFIANNTLFAEAHYGYATEDDADDDYYSLYYYDGSAFTLAADLPGQGASNLKYYVGAAFDTTTSTYWFATKSGLYEASSLTGAATDRTSAAGLSGLSITCLYYAPIDDYVYVGTSGGDLYRSADGSTWDSKSVGYGGAITAIVDVGDYAGGTSSHLLVGEATDDTYTYGGYHEGTWSSMGLGTDGSVTGSASSLYTTTVYGKAMTGFYWDSTSKVLFACLAPGTASVGYGLYSTTYSASDSSWSGWEAE